jgi:Ca-activated chloride channel family protein
MITMTPAAHAPLTTLTLMTDDEVRSLGAARRDDAGFGALQTDRGPLPLIAMAIDARITGLLAGIELEQTFVNSTGSPIEATYIFPLPDRAAVTRFRMEVAGRIIDGVVEERGAAREQYDQAIAAGHRAAITEEERGGVFTLRVGNLMPGEAATVRLTLTGPLPLDDGEVTFQFPLVVAPRYIPGAAIGGPQAGTGLAADTDAVPDASRITPPVLLPGQPNPVRLSIRATIDAAGVPVTGLTSSLHAVSETVRAGVTVVELRPPGGGGGPTGSAGGEGASPLGNARLDRDFILRWKVGDSQVRSCVFCADDADGKAGTFVVTLVPPTEGVQQRPRDVVFVIDRSGSMSGWKMVAARRAVARMIDSLNARDRFTVLAFDNTIDVPPGHTALVDGTDRNRFRTVEFLATLEARGGTEMAQPLAHAAALLAGGYDERDRVLVLATDGQVGNEDQILRELAPRLKNVRVFALGIDRAVNAAFLRRLAAAGGGACEIVESEDRLDQVMDKVHRRIGTPVVTELAISGDSLVIETGSVTPRRLPDLFVGAPVVIAGRYRGRAPARSSVWITGRSLVAGGMREQLVARDALTGADAAALSAVWARGRVRDLEDQYITGGQSAEIEREIVSVSKRFSVLSRFTAFLAVDRQEVVNPGGEVRIVTQPVEMPSGWAGKQESAEKSAKARGRMAGPMMGGGAPLGRPGSPVAANAPAPARAQARSFDEGAMAPPSFGPSSTPPAQSPFRASPPGAPRPAESSPIGLPPGGIMPPMGPPPPPMAPPRPGPRAMVPRVPMVTERERRAEEHGEVASDAPYRARLIRIAEAIETALAGPSTALASALALALLRLTEWSEDARSVGLDDLVAAVTPIADELARAVRDEYSRTSAATEVARRLRELGSSPSPTGSRKSRVAFWK